MDRERIRIGRLDVDVVTFDGAIDAIAAMVASKRGGTVFTPNVDHVVMAEHDAAFRDAYARVSLSLADGKPVVWASQLLGTPLPAKISGSDLVEPLVARADREGWRVYLLGGGPGVAERAAENLRARHQNLVVVGTSSPRVDMSAPASTRAELVAAIAATRPDVVFVALGAPKQELFIAEVAEALGPAVLLGVGAAVDFLAGTVARAPAWISASGLEWLYRLGREPRRLWRRYLVRDPEFLLVLARDLYAARQRRS